MLFAFFFLFNALALVFAKSFYDNPEQDPLSSSTDAIQELKTKWDFEARQSSFQPQFLS